MKYIMLTYFENYWDGIPKDTKASYSLHMIPGKGKEPEKIIEKTQTIFIKRNQKTKMVEKAWEGFVDNFETIDSRIYFKVNIENKIPIPRKYSNYSDGWYFEESESKDDVSDKAIYPPFFNVLKTTTDWQEFENLTFLLLKLLGIHDIYKYESKEQSGKADGFFIFKKLAVLYDCTLNSDFLENKKQQIENYVATLNTGKLEYQGCEKTFSLHDKQVWIITRGSSQKIKAVNDVVVKEVSIHKIIEIYQNRLKSNIDENTLEKQLMNT